MKVLLLPSNPQVTDQVMTGLADGGRVSYEEVWSAERALALLDDEDRSYDIVIADNDTVPAGGFYLSREIKARVRMGRDMPPLLLLVAREQDDYLARWAEVDAWILKPVDPFDLAEAVEALVERRPVPALPGVKTFAELGAIHGPGQAGELPSPGDAGDADAAGDQPRPSEAVGPGGSGAGER